jgi:hypothetical protein
MADIEISDITFLAKSPWTMTTIIIVDSGVPATTIWLVVGALSTIFGFIG